MNVYRSSHHFDESRPFEPWFLRSVTNLSIKAAQRHSKQVQLEPDSNDASLEMMLAAQEPLPEEQVEVAEFQQRLWRALMRLSPRQRAAVVQRYYLDMSEKEMAAELEAAPGTVKWLLNQARKNLRLLLGSERNVL
jgi:RNA polymerase sigma-70 factor (ECF subfamily)